MTLFANGLCKKKSCWIKPLAALKIRLKQDNCTCFRNKNQIFPTQQVRIRQNMIKILVILTKEDAIFCSVYLLWSCLT